MPDLADVEGFRRFLARHAEGRRIVGLHVPDCQIVRNRSPQALLLHFGMTGLLTWSKTADGRHPHDRLIFVCVDQRLLAGVGNLLSDEILWRARIHPEAPIAKLTATRRDRLYEALHAAVTESTRYACVPHGPRWLTRVRDDRNPRCPRCGSALTRATVAGRTACWCPRCQR